MKKYLLLLITMLCASIGAWGDAINVTTTDGLTIIACTEDENADVSVTGTIPSEPTNIKITGTFTSAISDKLASSFTNFNNFTRLDLSETTGVTTTSLSTYSLVQWGKMPYIKHLILPTDASVPTAEQIKNNGTGSLDAWDNMEYFVIPLSNGNCNIYLTDEGLTTIDTKDIIIGDKTTNTINVCLAEGEDQTPATETTKSAIETYLKAQGYKIYTPKYIINDCNVTINMGSADGNTLAGLLTEALAAVKAGGQENICTLTVTGELSNNDLIALGGSDMTGATRIDLSSATLSSGVAIDNLQIPAASLTLLVLPKGQTVSVGLASKLAAAASLEYAYSPSSSTQDNSQVIADYVWVNKAGGLKAAANTEATLRTAVYVKIESQVALNEDDARFGSMGISANTETNYPWQFIDLSGAVVTKEATLAASAPHNKGYRIILPDNLTGNNMAIFASNSNKGSVAALYSYTGTTLRILEIDDSKYKATELHDARIVLPGTIGIEVVSGTYNGTTCRYFGDLNGNDNNLLAAINNAEEHITTVTFNHVAAQSSNLTFTNPHIKTLQTEGIHLYYNESQGSIINVTDCSSLETLNITNSVVNSLDASGLTSLITVNLSGTTINGNGTAANATTNLSGTSIKTLTTNSSTAFDGDLNLKNTASYSRFSASAKVTGDIWLNASGVTSVDLQGIQFQNTNSQIHIDNTEEEGTVPLTALNTDDKITISIPNGFNKARLHPYASETLDDNIAEATATSDMALDDGCKIEYDTATGVATVTAVHPECFKTLMEKNSNFSKFPTGTIFTFDATCKLNSDDLAALAGNATNGNYNKYFVDLYNLPASYIDNGTTCNYETIITAAIGILRTNNWQYRGLLLPKAVTTLGTTLIMDRSEDDPKLATCSESIAYSGTVGASGILTASYIYKAADDWGIDYQARLLNLKNMIYLHNEIVTTTTHFSVSSNCATPLDLSALPATTTVGGKTVNTSKLETINNDMVAGTGTPSIYAYPAYEGVMYDVMTATNIGRTPNLETLKVTGPVSAADIESVNNFTDGPHVFDLSEATDVITKDVLESITNSKTEYIILSEGVTKDVVCGADYTSGLKTNLKAVISSSNTELVAYVNTAGSLAKARYLATGGSVYGDIITPRQTGLNNITLAGNLNAADITANTTTHFVDGNGHWKTGSGNEKNVALTAEQGTITTIDLKDAVFATQTDMNFSYAGLSNIRNITLPVSSSMTLIPEECFMGITSFDNLCIPYNYTHIDDAALYGTYVSHITTTDASGALIDNGANSYTLSANLQEIGTKPATADANGVYSLSRNVFPQNRPVYNCYVLATRTPKCYANAFPANMLYGWGGFDGTLPYCRDKYVNGSNYFCVLRFPSQESWTAASPDGRDDPYELMKKQYTDITKVYTKKEQSGAVDANGEEITWPTFSELRRAYNQATNGITWNKWKATYDSNLEVNGGDNIPTSSSDLTLGDYTSTDGTGNNDLGNYTFTDYEGWHQFTLTQATYVEPDEVVEEEQITREYEDAGWFTFCIPYDMTVKQVKEWLGVPKSEGNVICKYNGSEVTSDDDEKMPDIRQLNSVTRHTSTGAGDNNKVTFRLTTDLYNNGNPQYLTFDHSASPGSVITKASVNSGESDDICLRGGIPYIIKAYKRKGETIRSSNLGQYIMTRYGDQFKLTASCLNHGDRYYEQLGDGERMTLRFAKPFEEHKIQAMNDAQAAEYLNHYHSDKPYYYTLVGQFWTQKLPRYCFYQSQGKWYRNTTINSYKWSAYKCVIIATPVIEDGHSNGGRYRDNDNSNYPSVEAGTEDKLDGTLKIAFADGLNDDDFQTNQGAPRYLFSLGNADASIEYEDENGNVTAITNLDGEDIVPESNRIYSMNGQYMGDSANGLAKGIYIMNGKKFMIK